MEVEEVFMCTFDICKVNPDKRGIAHTTEAFDNINNAFNLK